MTEETFWGIIATSLRESGGDTEAQMHLLTAALAPLGIANVRQFQSLARHFQYELAAIFSAPNSAFDPDLEKCPDDDFFAWRVVSKGQAVYEQALAETDADALEDLLDEHGVEETNGSFLHFIEVDLDAYGDDHCRHYREKEDRYVAGQDLGYIRDGLVRLREDANRLSVSLRVLRSCTMLGSYRTMDKAVSAGITQIITHSVDDLEVICRRLSPEDLRHMAASLRFLQEIAK